MKRELKRSSERGSFFNKKGVPSKINRDLKMGRIDAAFISSIASRKRRCVDLGIVAKREVKSVFVLPEESFTPDPASETSNALAKILKVQGRVIIGDEGLREYYRDRGAIDLAKLWNEKTSLPFPFARLCCNRRFKRLQRISKRFEKSSKKIPMYILKQYEKKTQIEKEKIVDYLSFISYSYSKKEKLALKKFLNYVRITK